MTGGKAAWARAWKGETTDNPEPVAARVARKGFFSKGLLSIPKDEKDNTGHYIKTPSLYNAKKGRRLLLRSRIDFHDGLLRLIRDIKKN